MKKISFVIFVLCLSIVGAFAQEQITVSRFQGQKITGIKESSVSQRNKVAPPESP